MKVMHVPFCFRPDVVGGTEVYVDALAREQGQRGLDVAIAAPASATARYMDDGLPVHRFAVSDAGHDLRRLYGAGDDLAGSEFGDILDREKPQIVHLHAFTSAISASLAREVKARGVGLVFTYHTPTATCARGTLLQFGRRVCDGHLRVHRCAACALHGLGGNRAAAVLLGSVPARIGTVVGRLGLAGRALTSVRMTELLELQQHTFRSFAADTDRFVVLCTWASELLMRNGVPRTKITLSRHGLRGHASEPVKRRAREQPGHLRIAFLGRLHPTKGLDVLIQAVRALPRLELELDVFGLVQGETADGYAGHLRSLAADDPRIRFCEAVPSGAVTTVLADYDVLAVPSRWLETGPLVVLEAVAAGVPVLGSNLGGIAELVRHRVDGLLVKPGSATDWSLALKQLVEDGALLARLANGVRPPRRMDAVADDMLRVYRQALGWAA
jgi:glycosyltransferase involved in cell wall biosynthesis